MNVKNHHLALAMFWLACVSVALLGMYSRRQGTLPHLPSAALIVPDSPADSPADSSARPAASLSAPEPVQSAALPTLRMFIHPQCPCSRASVHELERLVAHCQGKLKIEVYFYKPAEETDDWIQTYVWKTVQSIPGVQSFLDEEGVMAQRYAAQRSGQVVLQSATGALLFTGGITDGAGHEGDNAGRDAVEAWIAGRKASSMTPVFGCEIF